MNFLPPSTNAQYEGHILACVPVALTALQSLVGGTLHVVLPDSGMASIAGLNLAHEGGLTMVSLAAWVGATQIAWGLLLAVAILRYRSFTLPLLVLVSIEKALIMVGQVLKPVSGASPPGLNGAAILLVLSVLAIFAARPKSD